MHHHRRIALITATDPTRGQEHEQGYLTGTRRHGLDRDPRLRITTSPDAEHVSGALTQLLTGADPATALITADPAATTITLRTLGQLKLTAPVALTACEDFPTAELMTPTLTAVTHDWDHVGTQLAATLLNKLAHPNPQPPTP